VRKKNDRRTPGGETHFVLGHVAASVLFVGEEKERKFLAAGSLGGENWERKDREQDNPGWREGNY